ncbi:lipase family protein [Nocardia crassostreae]|uniref:lipase family protein n=1 Tax=Nocardia crassostreae TaxID=53428 RepID=UPI001FDFB757|nr:lipase family protein [Nocardia crassostreae]
MLAALIFGCVAGHAQAQPPEPGPGPAPISDFDALQRWIETHLPAPVLPAAPMAPLVDAGGLSLELAALRAATMPKPIDDGFVDTWPELLGDYANGDIVAWRDVTAAAQQVLLVPARQVLQLKFRTTDSHDAASYAVATLVIPPGEWTGPGRRPVVVNNLPINGLGRDCNPSYTLARGWAGDADITDYIPPTTQLATLRGYAVLITDHEGPRMAYAEPYVAGHAVLDSIRAVRNALPDEFGDSRFGMIGYSGGAIATNGAVKLMAEYAPELADVVVGAAMGGVPADFELLGSSMNGNLASGVFLAATFAIGRERPEILDRMNALAQWIALVMKDQCMDIFALPGVFMLPIELAADIPDPLHSALAHDIYRLTRMEGKKSLVPLYIYNGEQEFWVPAEGARNFYREQCALGVNAVYRDVFGEHIIAAFTGYPESLLWLDERLRGEPAISEC